MFKIKPASDVVARKGPVYLGSPDYTYPDVVFTTEFSKDIIVPMNSIVLRTALLNSAAFLEKFLKVKVVDVASVQAEPKVVKPKKKKSAGEVEWK